jgi:hypothetical protein
MEEQQIESAQPEDKRPTLLTVLCILTFIGSGLNAFSNLMVFVFYDAAMKFAAEMITAFKLPGMELFLSAIPAYFAITALINVVAVTGAVMMWNLRKIGFHVYTVSQILVILAPMYFFRFPGPDFFSIILCGIFVLLYSYNLKRMK